MVGPQDSVCEGTQWGYNNCLVRWAPWEQKGKKKEQQRRVLTLQEYVLSTRNFAQIILFSSQKRFHYPRKKRRKGGFLTVRCLLPSQRVCASITNHALAFLYDSLELYNLSVYCVSHQTYSWRTPCKKDRQINASSAKEFTVSLERERKNKEGRRELRFIACFLNVRHSSYMILLSLHSGPFW